MVTHLDLGGWFVAVFAGVRHAYLWACPRPANSEVWVASDLSLLAVCQVATVQAALFWLVAHVVGIGTLVVSDYNHPIPLLNRPILFYRGVKPSLLPIVGDVTKVLDLLHELLTNAGLT